MVMAWTGFWDETDVFEYMKVNGERYRNYKSFRQIDFGSRVYGFAMFNIKCYSAAAKITHTHIYGVYYTLIRKYERSTRNFETNNSFFRQQKKMSFIGIKCIFISRSVIDRFVLFAYGWSQTWLTISPKIFYQTKLKMSGMFNVHLFAHETWNHGS